MIKRQRLLSSVFVVGVVVASAAVVSPAVAADSTGGCDGQTRVALSDLDDACSSFAEEIDLAPGRTFAVPEAGVAVTFSATTALGTPDVDDVTVARSSDGAVAVEVGEKGQADREVYGSPDVIDEFEDPESTPTGEMEPEGTVSTEATSPKCESYKYSINNYRWTGTFQWRYKTPSFSGQAAVSRGIQSMANGTGACGANKPNSAAASYLGTTTVASSVNSKNVCNAGDYNNVIDSGALPSGILAATCTYKTASQIFAADVKISTAFSWYVGSSDTGCTSGKYDLQGVMTHEAGHVFGLNHVSTASNQVMKKNSSTCETGQRKLGNGDLAGMKKLYP